MNGTLIILGCIGVIGLAIEKVRRAAEGSNNPDVILNSTTLTFVGGVGIAILIALAALSMK